MAKKVSFADRIYDRFCDSYVLKAGKGGPLVQKNLFTEYRASSYSIDGLGRLVLLRETGLFGPKQETAIFLPLSKDAPVMSIICSHKAGKQTMEVQLPEAMLSPIRYQQFSRVLDNYGKLQDQQLSAFWQEEKLLPGSAAKTGSNEELSALLEEYLSAYLRVLDMAQPCDRTQKRERLAKLAEAYLKGGEKAGTAQKFPEEQLKHIFDLI